MFRYIIIIMTSSKLLFLLYQVVLGLAFRIFTDVTSRFKITTKLCWTVNRGQGLSPIQSCEGTGENISQVTHVVGTMFVRKLSEAQNSFVIFANLTIQVN